MHLIRASLNDLPSWRKALSTSPRELRAMRSAPTRADTQIAPGRHLPIRTPRQPPRGCSTAPARPLPAQPHPAGTWRRVPRTRISEARSNGLCRNTAQEHPHSGGARKKRPPESGSRNCHSIANLSFHPKAAQINWDSAQIIPCDGCLGDGVQRLLHHR